MVGLYSDVLRKSEWIRIQPLMTMERELVGEAGGRADTTCSIVQDRWGCKGEGGMYRRSEML